MQVGNGPAGLVEINVFGRSNPGDGQVNLMRDVDLQRLAGESHQVIVDGGGCASRRALFGNLNQPDPYCPLVRGETIDLSFTPAPEKDLPRGSNVCTSIIVP